EEGSGEEGRREEGSGEEGGREENSREEGRAKTAGREEAGGQGRGRPWRWWKRPGRATGGRGPAAIRGDDACGARGERPRPGTGLHDRQRLGAPFDADARGNRRLHARPG